MASIDLFDIETSVADARRHKDAGLKGVVLPTSWTQGGIEPYADHATSRSGRCARSSTCRSLRRRRRVHRRRGLQGPRRCCSTRPRCCSAGQRPFAQLVWSAVLEHHPDLKVVFAESGAEWVIERCRRMDMIYTRSRYQYIHNTGEALAERVLEPPVLRGGVDDEPVRGREPPRHRSRVADVGCRTTRHYEGTWPNTQRWLVSAFGELPQAEVKMMLTDTPARVYGFDVEKLAAVAAGVGPDADELERTRRSRSSGSGERA